MKNGDGLSHLTDAQLINMVAKTNCSKALETLMKKHRDVLIFIGRRFLRRRVLLEDFLQETWMLVLVLIRKNTYAEHEHFAQWLHTIAYRKAKDMYKIERHLSCDADAISNAEETLFINPKEVTDLERILSMLPPWQQRVMRKRVVEDKSVAETAKELNMTPGAVTAAYSKAIKRLQQFKNII